MKLILSSFLAILGTLGFMLDFVEEPVFGAQTLVFPSRISTTTGIAGNVLAITNGSWNPVATSTQFDGVQYTTISETRFYQASSTIADNLSWYFGNGGVLKASSTIASTTFAQSGRVGVSTSSPSAALSVGGHIQTVAYR